MINFIQELTDEQLSNGIQAIYKKYGFDLSKNYEGSPLVDRGLYDLLFDEILYRNAQSEQEKLWTSYSKRYNELVYGDS